MATRAPDRLPWQDVIDAGRGEQVVREARYGGSPAEIEPLPSDLHPELLQALGNAGIDHLYSHQAEALRAARENHTIVTTGTASGKSLAFNLPVLDTLAHDRKARAIYLYPTKALAQDQARKLSAYRAKFLRHAIYDGDTPRDERSGIRQKTNLFLTNPDMLNLSVLPNHRQWGDVLANLAWIVVDEAHVYRGVFGSHVGNVLRRLRRVARAYGTEPRFILTSATIANPVELGEGLSGHELTLVDRDGAPRAERRAVMWNPPLTDEKSGARRSALGEASDVLAELVAEEVRTICFMKSRRGVELLQKFTKQKLEDEGHPDLADRIAPYRAGYTPAQRREIERRLADGELLAVCATNALELGIDIGELDAAICVSFPGTVASLRQMWGRAGRRRTGLALYIAGDDALDQFFCRHPDEFLDRPVESAILDYESEEIHLAHLAAAAFELPLSAEDEDILGPRWQAYADRLVQAGELREKNGRYTPRAAGFAAGRIAMRSASTDSFAVVDIGTIQGDLVGTVESARAFRTIHPGAIYMHLGQSYEVEELELHDHRALVRTFSADWYTQPKTETDTFIESVKMQRMLGDVELNFGTVSVSEEVVAYQRKHSGSHEPIDLMPVELPEQHFVTQALWYVLPEALLLDEFPLDVLQGSLHAAEHAQIAVLPLIAMCDRWDIGGLSTAFHAQTGRPTIFIYDGHPGGVGITRMGYNEFERLTDDALRLISECPCESGCPSCVQSPKCGNLNEPLNKNGSIELLKRVQGT